MAATSSGSETDSASGFQPGFCCMHVFNEETGPVTKFTETSWGKFLKSSVSWARINGCIEANLVERAAKHFKLDLCVAADGDHHPIPDNAGYHRRCYQRFCNVNKIKQAEDRQRRLNMTAGSDADVDSACGEDDDGEKPPKKRMMLRSSISPTKADSIRPNVLPNECVICRCHKYERDRITGSQRRLPLVKCERIHSRAFIEAAEMRQHQRILTQIKDRDMVAIEVRYHKKCYKEFTRCAMLPKEPLSELESSYSPSYLTFCENIVKPRLIHNHEILRLTTLNKLFIKTLFSVQCIRAPSYKTHCLKKKLQETFPQLNFIQPRNRNESEIVYLSTL